MESTINYEEGFDEQWDDMAIVRAFEEAMLDQHTRRYTSTKSNSGKHNMTHINGKTESNSVRQDNKEYKEQNGYGNSAASAVTGAETHGHPNRASFAGFAAKSGLLAPNDQQQHQVQQHQVQQQASNDVYQAAYAQAYAHIQAQLHAANPATVAQQPYGPYARAPAFMAPSTYNPPLPPLPAIPTPFPGMPSASASFPGVTPNAAETDDGLANVLLAWYQSGYYTGRFQTVQEMKLHGRR